MHSNYEQNVSLSTNTHRWLRSVVAQGRKKAVLHLSPLPQMLQRAEHGALRIRFQPPEKDEPTLEVSGARWAHSPTPAAIAQQPQSFIFIASAFVCLMSDSAPVFSPTPVQQHCTVVKIL